MSVRVFIEDHTGNTHRKAKVSTDAEISQLLPAIVTSLNLPTTSSFGTPVVYHLVFNDRQLAGNETLASVGVPDDATLTVVPEMLAGCFPAGTLIALADGSTCPIEMIEPGDTVCSYDVDLQANCTSTVERVLRQPATQCLVINNFLKITSTHLVFSDERWRPAGELRLGNNLRTQNGDQLTVQTIEERRIENLVYNLHLSEIVHTFFADGILVHNAAEKLAHVSTIYPVMTLHSPGDIWRPEKGPDSPCVLHGPDRQQVVQEIAEAVEARLLVKVLAERPDAEPVQADAQSAVVVRPVFGAPVSSATVNCDVFMMMPFAEAYQSIYHDYIKPVAAAANLTIRRADDFFSQHNIINEIWTALCLCRFAIADCTGRNPNVLYELGIAHTLGKRVILLAQSEDDIPFDVQGRRVIIYQDRSAGLKHLQRQLSRTVELILAELRTDDEGPASNESQ